MSILIACPGCQAKFQADAKLAGRQVSCPACRTPFRVPAPVVNLGPDLSDLSSLADMERVAVVKPRVRVADETPVDNDVARMEKLLGHEVHADVSLPRSQLDAIRLGLRLHLIATVLALAATVLGSIAVSGVMFGAAVAVIGPTSDFAAISAGAARSGIAGVVLPMAGVAMLMALGSTFVSPILDLIGSIVCLCFPIDHGCRGWMIGSLACRVGHPVIVGGLMLFPISREMPVVVLVAAIIVALTGWLCFMTSLQRFAKFLQRNELVEEAEQIMLFGVALVLLSVAIPGFVLWLVISERWGWLAVILFSAGLIGNWLFRSNPLAFLVNGFMYGTGIGFLIRYANFLGSLHHVRVKVR